MLTSNNKPNIDFINNLFNINLYYDGNLQKIKSDNKIPDNILMQAHLTEFSVTVKYIIDKIITLAQNTEEKNDKKISDNILANKDKISNSIDNINKARKEIIKNNKITNEEIDIVIGGLMFDLEFYKGALAKINKEKTVIIDQLRKKFKTTKPAETIPQLSVINFCFLEDLLNHSKLANAFIIDHPEQTMSNEEKGIREQLLLLNMKMEENRKKMKSNIKKDQLISELKQDGKIFAALETKANNLSIKNNQEQDKHKKEYDKKNQLEKMTHLVDKLCEYIAKQDFDKLKTSDSDNLGEKLKTFLKALGEDANDKNDFYCKISEQIKARWVESKAILDPIFDEKTIQESRKNIVPLGEHINNLSITSGINIERRAEVINELIEGYPNLLPTDCNLYSCKPFFLPTGFPVYAPEKVVNNTNPESLTISDDTSPVGFNGAASNTTNPIGFNNKKSNKEQDNGFMTKFTPPINYFQDLYLQNTNTKLKTEQSDLSQELCLKINPLAFT